MDRPNWKQSPTNPALRRAAVVIHGFVCPDDHPDCASKPEPQRHGVATDIWAFVVTDGRFAIAMEVYGNTLKGAPLPPRMALLERPMPAHLSKHAPRRTSEYQDENGVECTFIEAGRCFPGGSSLAAADFWKTNNGRPGPEQSESFWRALEAKWFDWNSEDINRKTVKTCPTCDGRGWNEVDA